VPVQLGFAHAAVREKRLLIGLGGQENRTGGRFSGEGGEGAHVPVHQQILQKIFTKKNSAEAEGDDLRGARRGADAR
jgi:hypothetical protein